MFARTRARVLSATAGDVGPAAASATAQQPAETAIPDKVRLFIPYKDYSAEDNQRILEMDKWLRVADVSDGWMSWAFRTSASSTSRFARCGRTPRSSRTARWASR